MTSRLPLRRGSAAVPLMDRVEDGLLPLINLVFLLLMFFLVAGVISRGELPPLPNSAHDSERDLPAPDLTLAADGSLKVRGQTASLDSLGALLPVTGESALRIGAEKGLALRELEAVLAALEDLGHEKIILLTEPEA